MGKIKGFMEFDRLKESVIDPKERIKNAPNWGMVTHSYW